MEFGMLACCREIRGLGVGTALVHYVIALAQQQGKTGLRMMIIEPKDPHHTNYQYNAKLKRWYERFGFRLARIQDVREYFKSLHCAPTSATTSEIDPGELIIVPCNALSYTLRFKIKTDLVINDIETD